METIIVSEDNLINALCVYYARQINVMPENVEIELNFDDDEGYFAEAYYNGRKDIYRVANMLAAIRIFLQEEMNIDPYAASIHLEIDDEQGMIAIVE